MITLSDSDLFDYLKCPALWYAKKNKLYQDTENNLLRIYFQMYLFEDENFAPWLIGNSTNIYYSGSRGSMKPAFNQCHLAAERLIADPYISKLVFDSEALLIETEVYDVPVRFIMNGVNLEKESFFVPVLGPGKLTQKKPVRNWDDSIQWVNWILADNWPAMLYFYHLAIKSYFCIDCLPLMATIEKNYVPDFELYQVSNIATFLEFKMIIVEALETMFSIVSGNAGSETLKKCRSCDFCRGNKKITEPKEFNLNTYE